MESPKKTERLNTTNTELLTCLDGMQQQRAALAAEVATHAAEKQRLEADLAALQARLVSVNDILQKKQASVAAFDQVIGQTQEALQKIIDSSSALLSVTKRNAADVSRLVQRI